MKKKIISYLFVLVSLVAAGQVNLVPNPSFEIFTSCPTFPNTIDSVPPWKGTNLDSDYFNACGDDGASVPYTGDCFQYARTGNGFAGQWFLSALVNYREYLQVPLTQSLTAGTCYLVKFFVNYTVSDLSYGCNNIGAYLSVAGFTNGPQQIPMNNVVNAVPQILAFGNPVVTDTLNWVEIGGVFNASGGESFLSIGNFSNDTNTTKNNNLVGGYGYYFVDDVSVQQVNSVAWIRDTIINLGDTVFIGSNYGGINCTWYTTDGQQIGTKPGLYVKPVVDTKYIVHQNFCGTTFIDTLEVKVAVNTTGILKPSAALLRTELFPNPAQGDFTLRFVLPVKQIEVMVFDLTGRTIIKESKILETNNELNYKINLMNGTYLVKVNLPDGTYDLHRLVISK